MLEELGVEEFVREQVEKNKWMYGRVSSFLKETTGVTKGVSERSVRRFCALKGIKRSSRINDQELDKTVVQAVSLVGQNE